MEHGREQKPNFIMKVKGHYRTALARQVAEAVWIRRRGGEGAILNSKGEFSRSYIPRLQVVEEEPKDDAGTKEKTSKYLREQEGEWEHSKTMELGRDAILGPMSSPTKRMMEQTEGAVNKRRKKLKFELIEEGWGSSKNNREQGRRSIKPKLHLNTPVPGSRRLKQGSRQSPSNREGS